jgi:hypothetical protein
MAGPRLRRAELSAHAGSLARMGAGPQLMLTVDRVGDRSRVTSVAGPCGLVEKDVAFTFVAGKRRGGGELGGGFPMAAKAHQQFAPHARPQVRIVQALHAVEDFQRCGGPVIDTAIARLRSTTGDGASRPSASYSSTIRSQSVSDGVAAVAWHSASAACRA